MRAEGRYNSAGDDLDTGCRRCLSGSCHPGPRRAGTGPAGSGDSPATFGNRGKESKLGKLEGTARYTGLLPVPAEGFGLWPRFFCSLITKGFSCWFCPFEALFGVQ